MRNVFLVVTVAASIGLAVPAQGQFLPPGGYDRLENEGINEPWTPPRELNFAELRSSTPSSVPDHDHDPEQQHDSVLAQQRDHSVAILRAAVPAGMSAIVATAKLRKAGAACARPSSIKIICHYALPAPADEGTDRDDVLWQIALDVANGHITDLALTWQSP